MLWVQMTVLISNGLAIFHEQCAQVIKGLGFQV
jgi:hypothetical protein